jgi:malate/lactate dehydrogenase
VVVAGAAQRPGDTRLELLQKNAAVIRSIAGEARHLFSGSWRFCD